MLEPTEVAVAAIFGSLTQRVARLLGV